MITASDELYSVSTFSLKLLLLFFPTIPLPPSFLLPPFDLLSPSPSALLPSLLLPSLLTSSSSSLFLPCSSEVRWSRQMMILLASAPAPASRPSEASVPGGRCPRARQDLWGRPETRCHGTCPNMRGGRGRARTRCWTRRRGRWFVSQVRETVSHCTEPASAQLMRKTVVVVGSFQWSMCVKIWM